MDSRSLAQALRATTPYALYRVHPDGTEEPIPGTATTDPVEAVEHGYRLARMEPGAAFTLYEGGTPRCKFGHSNLKLRLRPGVVAGLVS